MKQINFENDIKPLSEFRAHAADFVKQIKTTKRPMVLTQHGKSAAILVDVSAYQAIIEELELLQEVQLAEQQMSKGETLSNEEVEKRLKARYSK